MAMRLDAANAMLIELRSELTKCTKRYEGELAGLKHAHEGEMTDVRRKFEDETTELFDRMDDLDLQNQDLKFKSSRLSSLPTLTLTLTLILILILILTRI